jgi:hypothetical protein
VIKLPVAFCATTMSMENYPSDWDKRRSKVLERDCYECQECATDLVTGDTQAHVHHIKPISEGGGHSYDNLEALCRECHINQHSHGKPKDPVEVYRCFYCRDGFTRQTGYDRDYCSKVCFSREKAEKLLNAVNSNNSICSSCHRPFGDGGVCPHCGNWEVNRDCNELNIERVRLLAHAYRLWKWGDDWVAHDL